MDFVFELEIEESNVISLAKKRIEYGGCMHHKMTIDENLDTVECNLCGEKLNPMSVLSRFAGEEKKMRTELIYKTRTLDIITKKLYEKCRTKCHHCSKMTPINLGMSDLDWRGFK